MEMPSIRLFEDYYMIFNPVWQHNVKRSSEKPKSVFRRPYK